MINDLKQFLEEHGMDFNELGGLKKGTNFVPINRLGLFFWERGGKQFVLESRNYLRKANRNNPLAYLDKAIRMIKTFQSNKSDALDAQGYSDALACLGEEKIEELIKGLNKE